MDLNSTLADMGKVLVIAKPHWPWFLYVAIFAFMGEVGKRKVFSVENAARMEREADKLWNLSTAGKFFASDTVRVPPDDRRSSRRLDPRNAYGKGH